MHTHTHTHVYKRIDVQIHTHMHICTYIHVRAHTHIHIYTHTHTSCTYERTQARLEQQHGNEHARSCGRRRELSMSHSLDAIKPHFAPPMQGLHCTHFLKQQYPSTPHPLFPTYPRTVRGLRVSAVSLFYTEHMDRVHNSEDAPHSFTMVPCVVVERLEGKQRCTEPQYASTQESKPENDQGDCSRRNKRSMKKRTNPAPAHDAIKTARCLDNIRSSALVRGRSIKFMACPSCEPQRPCPETRSHFRHFRESFSHAPPPRPPPLPQMIQNGVVGDSRLFV